MVPLDRSEFERWMAQADRALETARLVAEDDRHEWACFLAEQAAQLTAKGLLHGAGLEAWGHDLTVLVARLGDELGDWDARSVEAAARLSRHYIPTRYPDAHPSGFPGSHYTAADSEQAMADAELIRRRVVTAWQTLEEGG